MNLIDKNKDQVIIYPSLLKGSVTLPISKSIAHRVILASALAEIQGAPPTLDNIEKQLDNPAEDIVQTLNCGKTLVAHYFANHYDDNTANHWSEPCQLYCKDSGTTLRLILPIACTLFPAVNLTFSEGLAKRPLDPLLTLLKSKGLKFYKKENPGGTFTLQCRGKFQGGHCQIPGDISSQYISGLLYALPLSDTGGVIELTTQLTSKPYVDMTLAILRESGIKIKSDLQDGHLTYTLLGKQQFRQTQHNISQGDWSAAAFFAVANALGSQVTMTNLENNHLQGDQEIYSFIDKILKTDEPTIDLENHPDLFPVLAVLACSKTGTTTFTGVHRLKLKESDRIQSTQAMIESLKGGDVVIGGCGHSLQVQITGAGHFQSGTVDSFNDHRIAMAAAITACREKGTVTILNSSCCSKSYPDFFEDFRNLGGKID